MGSRTGQITGVLAILAPIASIPWSIWPILIGAFPLIG